LFCRSLQHMGKSYIQIRPKHFELDPRGVGLDVLINLHGSQDIRKKRSRYANLHPLPCSRVKVKLPSPLLYFIVYTIDEVGHQLGLHSSKIKFIKGLTRMQSARLSESITIVTLETRSQRAGMATHAKLIYLESSHESNKVDGSMIWQRRPHAIFNDD